MRESWSTTTSGQLGRPAAAALSWASTPAVRASMLSNRSIDTTPELKVRRAVHALGLRYRKHVRIVTPAAKVRADIVFAVPRVAVFIDGCFWHACGRHGSLPRLNGAWWRRKLALNVARDIRQRAALRQGDWHVVRVWEHENPDAAALRVLRAVTRTA